MLASLHPRGACIASLAASNAQRWIPDALLEAVLAEQHLWPSIALTV